MKALHTRIAAVAILVVSLAVLVPATAVAETKTYRFTISGTEVSATSTTKRLRTIWSETPQWASRMLIPVSAKVRDRSSSRR